MDTRAAQPYWAKPILLAAGALLVLFFLTRIDPAERFDVRNVSAAEASKMIEQGAVVVDVREKDVYDGRHIPGAISAPLTVLRKAIPATLSHATSKPVVVYCGDGVSIGPEGTALLNKAGYAEAVNLQAGIQGWADAGLPVIEGR